MLPLIVCVAVVSIIATLLIQKFLANNAIFAALLGGIVGGIAACVWLSFFDKTFAWSDAPIVLPVTAVAAFPFLALIGVVAKVLKSDASGSSGAANRHEGPPLIVAKLFADLDGDDPRHQIYGQAYGIEMQVDDEWDTDIVLLTQPDLIDVILEETDVTGEDARIVAAGITDVPYGEDGVPDLSVIDDEKNNWALVGHPSQDDKDSLINAKTQAVLAAGGRVIVCVLETTKEHIAARLAGFTSADPSRLVVALCHPNADKVASQVAALIHEVLSARGIDSGYRFIVSTSKPISTKRLLRTSGADGVYLEGADHDIFGHVLEAAMSLCG